MRSRGRKTSAAAPGRQSRRAVVGSGAGHDFQPDAHPAPDPARHLIRSTQELGDLLTSEQQDGQAEVAEHKNLREATAPAGPV